MGRHRPQPPLSAEETSPQLEAVFTAALESEGMLDRADALATGALRAALASDDLDPLAGLAAAGQVPLLLAISDNAPADALHTPPANFSPPSRSPSSSPYPHTPQDQAWIESLFGHIKGEWPRLEQIRDPGELEAELDHARAEYNTVRLHAGVGYVTPDDEHKGRGEATRQARRDDLARAREARIAYR